MINLAPVCELFVNFAISGMVLCHVKQRKPMKKILALALAVFALEAGAQTRPSYEIVGKDTICQIFLYSPADGDGLHVAYLTDQERWADAGRLCGSDYASATEGSRMRSPYVCHAADGSWRLLFSVDDNARCLAAAYSEDLVTWRPQDFPSMTDKGVREPVMFQMDDGTFDIYFKAQGSVRRYVKADKDFRHFVEAKEPSSISDDAWIMDTATVADKEYAGNMFQVPKIHLDYMISYLGAMAHDKILFSERMGDDSRRFADLGTDVEATLTIDPSKTKRISSKLVGVSFTGTANHDDNGLKAEMVRNGGFEYSPNDGTGLGPQTAWTSNHAVTIRTDALFSADNPHYAVMTKTDTLYNKGWKGMTAAPLQQFDCSLCLRTPNGGKNQVLVALVGNNGKEYAKMRLKLDGQGWQRYEFPLAVDKKMEAGDVRLALTPLKEGSVDVDMVSLLPHDTFKGHGLRKDAAETVAALSPKFVRFSKGAHGLGLYEFFRFCEDLGAEPIPVLPIDATCQDALDMIEWAVADTTASEMARKRAAAGHPAPFRLRYVSIGNGSHVTTAFEKRYKALAEAVKAKYPAIKVIGNAGPTHNPSADYTEGWKFAEENNSIVDRVGECNHASPGWFLHNQDYYDHYDREAPRVCLGEWGSQGSTVENALAEALFLCAVERNGDVVEMESHGVADGDVAAGLTPSYYTQKLWGNNSGDKHIGSTLSLPSAIGYRVSSSVVSDNEGKVIVKIVNALPARLAVSVSGVKIADGTVAEGIAGKPGDKAVTTVKTTVKGQKVTLPAYSVVVIRQ